MKLRMLLAIGGAVSLALLSGCGSTKPAVVPATPVLTQLNTITTIGSTIDSKNGDSNPYGLAIAPITAGSVTAGDLLVCNFNDNAGNAGNGTTIEDLSPIAGAMPKRIAQDPSLQGCAALATNPANGSIWAAAYTANDNPIFNASGQLVSTLASSYSWMNPWGQIYAAPSAMTSGGTGSSAGPSSFYITNAKDGSVVQAAITSSSTVFHTIATGFPVNLASQYGVLAPAGLTYDPTTDTLYIVSSTTSSVVAFTTVSAIPENGITVSVDKNNVYTFTGSAAGHASVVFSGAPLNYPVSSAMLYNGNLIVGNTGDNNMLEIDPVQKKMVGEKLVDKGNAGAIFGIVTTGNTAATQKIYFNDDNTNSVASISH